METNKNAVGGVSEKNKTCRVREKRIGMGVGKKYWGS